MVKPLPPPPLTFPAVRLPSWQSHTSQGLLCGNGNVKKRKDEGSGTGKGKGEVAVCGNGRRRRGGKDKEEERGGKERGSWKMVEKVKRGQRGSRRSCEVDEGGGGAWRLISKRGGRGRENCKEVLGGGKKEKEEGQEAREKKTRWIGQRKGGNLERGRGERRGGKEVGVEEGKEEHRWRVRAEAEGEGNGGDEGGRRRGGSRRKKRKEGFEWKKERAGEGEVRAGAEWGRTEESAGKVGGRRDETGRRRKRGYREKGRMAQDREETPEGEDRRRGAGKIKVKEEHTRQEWEDGERVLMERYKEGGRGEESRKDVGSEGRGRWMGRMEGEGDKSNREQ
ncbi:hypothetical protein Tco_0321082 [Tanacetum coccineum]